MLNKERLRIHFLFIIMISLFNACSSDYGTLQSDSGGSNNDTNLKACQVELRQQFAESLWPLMNSECMVCHASSVPKLDLSIDETESFYDIDEYLSSATPHYLYAKPSQLNGLGHKGGAIITEGDSSYETISQYVADDEACRVILASDGDNYPPVIVNQIFELDIQNTRRLQGRISANDPNGDTVEFVILEPPSNGSLDLNLQGEFEYETDQGFLGTDAFKVVVRDREGLEQEAEMIILVKSGDDEQNIKTVLTTLDVYIQMNQSVNYQLVSLDGDDDSLDYFLFSRAVHGDVDLTRGGVFTYVPQNGFVGSESFVVDVSDGKNIESFRFTVHVHPQYTASDSVSRRLNNRELSNTIRDWLGDDSNLARTYLAPDERGPFDTLYTAQRSSLAYITQFELFAREIASRVTQDNNTRSFYMPCDPTSNNDALCFQMAIESLGQKAFRRPLYQDEINARVPLLEFSENPGGDVPADFWTAINLLIQSFIMDPEFLYRIEIGETDSSLGTGVFKLSPYEMASRMSYLIWGSMPDDSLFEAAERNLLETAEGRRSQLRRMLADPKAREQIEHFHSMWLGYSDVKNSETQLNQSLTSETGELIQRIIFDENADYFDLFRMQETYLNDYLGSHYGLPLDGTESQWVAYGEHRGGGILSHGSFLNAFNKFSDTSPTKRGILIKERLWCAEKLAVPTDVDVDTPPEDPVNGSPCKIDRYRAHSVVPSCAHCHEQVDPIGFGLENFNRYGQYREHDDGSPECVIEEEGYFDGYGPFRGPGELSTALLAAQVLERCVVRHYLNFSLGRSYGGSNEYLLENMIFSEFEASGFRFQALMESVVSHPSFALRKEAVE